MYISVFVCVVMCQCFVYDYSMLMCFCIVVLYVVLNASTLHAICHYYVPHWNSGLWRWCRQEKIFPNLTPQQCERGASWNVTSVIRWSLYQFNIRKMMILPFWPVEHIFFLSLLVDRLTDQIRPTACRHWMTCFQYMKGIWMTLSPELSVTDLILNCDVEEWYTRLSYRMETWDCSFINRIQLLHRYLAHSFQRLIFSVKLLERS